MQLFRRPGCPVARCTALNPPALAQGAGVDRVEPELIQQFHDRRFRAGVVARNRQRPAIAAAGGFAIERCEEPVDADRGLPLSLLLVAKPVGSGR